MYCTCGGPGSRGMFCPPELDPPLLPPPLLPLAPPLVDEVPPVLPAPPLLPGSVPGFDVDGDPSSPPLLEDPELQAKRSATRSAGRRIRGDMLGSRSTARARARAIDRHAFRRRRSITSTDAIASAANAGSSLELAVEQPAHPPDFFSGVIDG